MLRKRWLALAGVSVAATSIVAWAATTSYQLQTKLNSSGGTLQVRNYTAQTVSGSVAYRNFTTSAPVTVTVHALAGYAISGITKTGAAQAIAPNQTDASVNFKKADGTIQTLIASFTPIKYNVSSIVSGSGSVSPASSTAVNYNGSLSMSATPTYTNGYVQSITLSDNSKGSLDLGGVALPAAGKVPFTVTNVMGAETVNVTFGTSSVSAGSNKLNMVNTTTTIGGSASGTGTLAWTVTGVPAGSAVTTASLANATTATPSFTPDVVGTYYLKLTQSMGGTVLGTSTVQVTAVASTTDYMRSSCNGCHSPVGGASPSFSFGQWSTSRHKAASVNCVTCHTDSAMPTPVNTATVDAESYSVTGSTAGTVGTNYCAKCHAATVAVFQGSLHNTMPAGKLVCNDCHASGHNPVATAEACSTCHTAVTDHTAEAMAGKSCIQCHDKHNPATVTTALGPQPVHPPVTLYTFEEVGYQMNGGQPVPVQVDANGKGMPYSPKMTCGTSGCHVINGVDYTYDKISDHAFHSNQGRSEMTDSANGKFDATKNKPWLQSTAMVGKW